MDDIPLSVLIAALIVFLLVSGFFSIAETSMMALNRYRLRHLAKVGHRGARLAAQLLARTDKLLGVVLLGNNLINAASAALVTVITFRFFGESEWALSIATVTVTFFILVFSEITPKIVGAAYPERIAFPASYALTPLLKLFTPVVWFVNLFVQALLAMLRLKPGAEAARPLGPEELRTLVLEAGHYFPKKHQSILLNLFDLERIAVDDVMVPRHQIEALDLNASPEELRRQIVLCRHTRLPVYRDRIEEVAGVVHIRKALELMGGQEVSGESLGGIMAEPYFVPSGTLLLTQLHQFQEHRRRMGLVVDEYGELLGLVTLEDIIEEIIGEFASPSPVPSALPARQPDGSIVVEGAALLRDLNRKLGLALPLDGPKTLNGLILEYLQEIPEPGTSLKIAGQPLEILQTQDRAVKSVRILPRTPPS